MFINLQNVLIDENLYPRNQVYWKHTQQLMGAINTGAILPPIVVGRRDDRYVIIDGRHRYKAHLNLKKKKIGAIATHLKEDKWFAEAVRLNTAHGHGLSWQEKISASMILQRADYQPEEIASIVHIPLERLLQAIKTQGAWVSPTDIKPVVAKAPLAKEAKRKGREWFETAAAAGLEEEQKILSGASFERLTEELLVLLGDDHLDPNDENVVRLITSIVAAGQSWLSQHAKTEQNGA